MKKSYPALLIAAVLTLSACNEKAPSGLSEKTNQTDQTTLKLKDELNASLAEIDSLKAQLAEKQASPLGLQVNIEKVFDKSVTLNLPEDKAEELPASEANVEYSLSLPVTQVQWLDRLLWTEIIKSFYFIEDQTPNEENVSEEALRKAAQAQEAERKAKDAHFAKNPPQKDDLMKEIEKWFEQAKSTAEKERIPADVYHIESAFLGQRNNIASFAQYVDVYTGGAHGMNWATFQNVDLKNRKLIRLQDLLKPNQREALKEKLWHAYEYEWGRLTAFDQDNSTFVSKEDFDISDDFYFLGDSIYFFYPPYALGPYVMGSFELRMSFAELKELMHPDYLN